MVKFLPSVANTSFSLVSNKGEKKMSKTLYRTVWRCQEVKFENMNWDALISDTFNYLCGINDRNFIEAD